MIRKAKHFAYRDDKGRFCKVYWKRVIVDTKTGKYWPNPDP